ncbi:hypothetical protein QTP70_026411 [Hemibagrus guttatus]|uniref:MARVEL domain-containing protein n=1 Tax=Hemibagrus guttatus TaxID=175788 RepID=A0AAE0Q7H5_9TELE|nr:hypothetical protein QTP70_026411 [Hemibagrus guttatus]KAK3541431.1 hypothetical protein QTP86_025551 [Hemibagrus guttatus]
MSHRVVTTTSTTMSSSSGGCLDSGYCRSFQGLLKISQVVTLLIAFLCVHFTSIWTDYDALRYFEVVTLWFLFAFLFFFLLHMFQLQARLPCIYWALAEFFHYVLGTILIFVASIIVAVKSLTLSSLVAGSEDIPSRSSNQTDSEKNHTVKLIKL